MEEALERTFGFIAPFSSSTRTLPLLYSCFPHEEHDTHANQRLRREVDDDIGSVTGENIVYSNIIYVAPIIDKGMILFWMCRDILCTAASVYLFCRSPDDKLRQGDITLHTKRRVFDISEKL